MPVDEPIDLLSNCLQEIVYRKKNGALFKRLARETHFNLKEVEALAVIHRKIAQTAGTMNRQIFRDILHAALDFTENIRHLLVDRVFSAFDKNNALQVSVENWIVGLSVLLRGNLDERIHFAYQVYDLMKTNKLKKEQMFPMMRGCLIKASTEEDPDEAVKDMIDLLLKKMDIDRDGYISEEDFKTAVKERNLLFLECMGPVFPSREAQHVFMHTFTHRVG